MGAVTGLTPPFKVTNFFSQSNGASTGGWYESYHWKDVSYANVVTDLTTFIPARIALMCADCDYVASRISYPGQKQQDLLINGEDIDLLANPGVYTPTSTTASKWSCPLDTAILYRIRDSLNFHCSLWLHGVPESLCEKWVKPLKIQDLTALLAQALSRSLRVVSTTLTFRFKLHWRHSTSSWQSMS
jgi:hypothetical protein